MIYSARRKVISKILIWIFSITGLLSIAFINLSSTTNAGNGSWWYYWSDPVNILDNVKQAANEEYKIQDTAFDNISNTTQWTANSSQKISNTLSYISNNVAQYLQRIVFWWLTLGVIWLIWNWLMMVTKSVNKQWDMATVKKNIVNIWIWVIILTWFYAIISIMTALINMVFKK